MAPELSSKVLRELHAHVAEALQHVDGSNAFPSLDEVHGHLAAIRDLLPREA